MKASLFCAARYMGSAPHDVWPLSGEYYSGDAAVRSMQTTFDQFRCADEFGFDWVTVAERPTLDELRARLERRSGATLPVEPAEAIRAERDRR